MFHASRVCERLLVSSLVAVPLTSAAALATPQLPQPRNTELQRAAPYPWLPAPGPGRSFVVSELAQGGLDLNGDGDALDRVLHILPQSSGPVFSVGLASDINGPFLAGNTVALGVYEKDQGGTDLNGDGDAVDGVLHLVDASSGAVTNTGLALSGLAPSGLPLRLSEAFAAFAVPEAAQGVTDLNGDGDAGDRVLHVIELSSGAVTNTGLAVDVNDIELGGSVIAFNVPEFNQGQDLNGDGDLSDRVLHVIDAAQGTVHNLGVAETLSVSISAGRVAFRLSEDDAGSDLNGDGDLDDYVVQVFDVASGGTLNTALASMWLFELEGPYLVVAVSEERQGADLNQDGDEEDHVAFVRHLPTGAVTNISLAVSSLSGLNGRLLSLIVSEWNQGTQDLNGDGDPGDSVLHVVDLASGAVTNVGLQASLVKSSRRMVGFLVAESLQGTQDLNGDGDKNDLVWHAFDARTGITTNLGVAALDASALSIVHDDFVVCVATEFSSGQQDLNGDGDLDDDVVFLQRAGQPTQNVGVAVTTSGTSKSIANSGRRVLLPVFEAAQGQKDLNGDGDTSDNVLHVLDVP